MGRKCYAYGCKLGYDRRNGNDSTTKISMHKYPIVDKTLRYKWNRTNTQTNFFPSASLDLCSLHLNFSQLTNLMALVKSWCDVDEKTRKEVSSLLSSAIFWPITFSIHNKQVSFIHEQLQLIGEKTNIITITPQLTDLTYMTFASSPAAYRILREQDLLCLPSLNPF